MWRDATLTSCRCPCQRKGLHHTSHNKDYIRVCPSEFFLASYLLCCQSISARGCYNGSTPHGNCHRPDTFESFSEDALRITTDKLTEKVSASCIVAPRHVNSPLPGPVHIVASNHRTHVPNGHDCSAFSSPHYSIVFIGVVPSDFII